jgi:hypothetical protein
MESATYSRRSARIARRIPITLRWQPPGCDVQDDPAETALLSRYGCSVVCHKRVKFGYELFVMYPERGRSARARVVYRELTGGNENIRLALEFLGNDNFWGIEFPPAPDFSRLKTKNIRTLS